MTDWKPEVIVLSRDDAFVDTITEHFHTFDWNPILFGQTSVYSEFAASRRLPVHCWHNNNVSIILILGPGHGYIVPTIVFINIARTCSFAASLYTLITCKMKPYHAHAHTHYSLLIAQVNLSKLPVIRSPPLSRIRYGLRDCGVRDT